MLKESVIQIHRDIHQPIAAAIGLPNELYTSSDAFVEDRNKVMAPSWACIGFIEDLPESDFVFPVDFMDLPLLITRNNNDQIRVFHNVCSHRGMHLADEPCRTNGLVRCPYHSWTYQLDGKLRGTPHIGGFGIHEHEEFDKSASNLRVVRSTTWLGCIFVNLSGTAVDFQTYVEPLTRQFDELCSIDERDRFTSTNDSCRTQLTVKSNWKLVVENYLESYHLPTVHPELNRISPLQEHFCLEYFDQGAGQGSMNYQRLNLDDQELPTLNGWPEDQQKKALYPTLYPNTLIGLHADHLFIMMLQPTAKNETVEHVRISYVGSDALDQRFANHHQQMLDNWSEVFGEDIFAVERMQKGRSSPGYAGGKFAPAMDEPTVHFHRWIAQCLLNGAKNNKI
jgi:choline monooxygenase